MEPKAEIFLQDFSLKFSAETKIMPLSVDLYRVGHLLADQGWVDLDLEYSIVMLGQ